MSSQWFLWLGTNILNHEENMQVLNDLGFLYGVVIQPPDWEQISYALSLMDGVYFNELSLNLTGDGSLMAGGGNNGRYIVVYFPPDVPDKSSLTLTDQSLTGPDMEITIQVPSSYPAKWCVKLPLVLKVFEYFFRYERLPVDAQWESDDAGE